MLLGCVFLVLLRSATGHVLHAGVALPSLADAGSSTCHHTERLSRFGLLKLLTGTKCHGLPWESVARHVLAKRTNDTVSPTTHETCVHVHSWGGSWLPLDGPRWRR